MSCPSRARVYWVIALTKPYLLAPAQVTVSQSHIPSANNSDSVASVRLDIELIMSAIVAAGGASGNSRCITGRKRMPVDGDRLRFSQPGEDGS